MSFLNASAMEPWKQYARFAGPRYRARRPGISYRRRDVVAMYLVFLLGFSALMLLISIAQPSSIPPLSHFLPVALS